MILRKVVICGRIGDNEINVGLNTASVATQPTIEATYSTTVQKTATAKVTPIVCSPSDLWDYAVAFHILNYLGITDFGEYSEFKFLFGEEAGEVSLNLSIEYTANLTDILKYEAKIEGTPEDCKFTSQAISRLLRGNFYPDIQAANHRDCLISDLDYSVIMHHPCMPELLYSNDTYQHVISILKTLHASAAFQQTLLMLMKELGCSKNPINGGVIKQVGLSTTDNGDEDMFLYSKPVFDNTNTVTPMAASQIMMLANAKEKVHMIMLCVVLAKALCEDAPTTILITGINGILDAVQITKVSRIIAARRHVDGPPVQLIFTLDSSISGLQNVIEKIDQSELQIKRSHELRSV